MSILAIDALFYLLRVFLEVAVDRRSAGRLEFDLFEDAVPRTAHNFRALCTGECGVSKVSGLPLTYKNSIFHRVIPGFMCQGGDFTRHDGTGGESIYGAQFEDENFKKGHSERGMLAMANSGPGTNGSQFYIIFKPTPHLDGKHVVFGKLVKGFDVLDIIENVPTDDKMCQKWTFRYLHVWGSRRRGGEREQR